MSDSLFGPPSSKPWNKLPQSGIVRRPDSSSGEALGAMRQGDAELIAGDPATAARHFVRALDLLEGGSPSLTVDAYLRLGRANQALGRVAACLHCYKKGIEIDPQHAPTLRAMVELHLEWREHLAAETLEDRLFASAGSTHERMLELMRSGDRWWTRAKDTERAKQRYQSALRECHQIGDTSQQQRVLARLRALDAA